MTQTQIDRTYELFDSLTQGAVEHFLSGCAEDLYVTVRGTDPTTTYVSKSEIADWYQSMESLAGPVLNTAVEVVQCQGKKSVVVVHYEFERDGIDHAFAMVHLCSFRGSKIASWTTFPLNLPDFARALGIRRSVTPQLV